jgi:putative membrane protein
MTTAQITRPAPGPLWPLVLLAALAPVLAWSWVTPFDRLTWWMEAIPVLIGVPLLALTYRRFPLSGLLYGLLFLHACILLVGAHYSYARVPAFSMISEWLGHTRNNYDKVGHFAQGFVPAVLAREILLRGSPFRDAPRSRWLPFLVVCVCLAFSAVYELFEWLSAIAMGSAATDFLGTQGDPWDTQTDMAMALVGAVAAMIVIPRWHDRSMARIGVGPDSH